MVAIPRAILVVLSGITLLPAGAGASSLGLMPRALPLNHPSQQLTPEQAFDALDEVEARLADADEGTIQLLFEAALLAAATGRPEDRLYAIEKLKTARHLDPDRLELPLWEAQLRVRSREFRSAASVLDDVEAIFSREPAFYFSRGIVHWLDARRRLGPESLERAARDFGRAHELRPDHLPFARAVAALALVRNDAEAGLRALPPAEVGGRLDASTLLLHGILLATRATDEERGEQLAIQAIRALPTELREMFENGGGLLPGVAEEDGPAATRFWWRRNPHPTRISNERRLLFWRRLVEADIVFGEDVPGWRTTPGEAWVRWGRPSVHSFLPPDAIVFREPAGRRGFTAKDPVELSVPAPSGGPATDLSRYTGGTRIDSSANINRWVWSYVYGDRSFQLVFNDYSGNFRWSLQGSSAALHEKMVEQEPVILPTRHIPHDFELAVAVTGRMPGVDRSALDAAIAVLPHLEQETQAEPENVEVDWALFDATGIRLDRGRVAMSKERSRSALSRSVDPGSAALDPRPARVARVGLSLEPGTYVLAVEATDTTTGSHEWARSVIELTRRPGTTAVLSDLMLSSTFMALGAPSDLPPEFVRYAQVIVPLAERQLPVGQKDVFVYFEAYDLGLDETGSTRIRVEYELEAVGGPAAATPDRERRHSFVEESTGQTAGGVVVKGTRLDLKGLAPGFYELRVVVFDAIREVETSRSLGFEIVDEQDLEG